MAEMEDKLNSILGNPQMMQQIMSMAQMLQQPEQSPPPPHFESQPTSAPQPPPSAPPPPAPQAGGFPGLDFAAMEKIMQFTRQSGIDKDQQALLRALAPFLSRERISKLEKAMRAAKISTLAASALGSERLQFLFNR